MAALDILQEVTGGADVTFSALNPGDLIVFQYMTRYGTSTVTTTTGLTLLASRSDEWPMIQTYARVVQSGDPLTWAFTPSIGGESAIRGYRIEGPFSSLSGVLSEADASFTGQTSRRVRTVDSTVAANTLVLAAVALDAGGTNPSSATNSFTSLATLGTDRKLSTARRLYASGATDVHTTFTWTTSVAGNSALIRIAAPAGGGGGTASGSRTCTSAAPLTPLTRNRLAGV